jgi:hypothetical protein
MATSLEAIENLSANCTNFLSVEDCYFDTSVGSWTTIGGSSSVDFSFRFFDQYHTLKTVPSSLNVVTLTRSNVSLPSVYSNDYVTFYGHIYCESKVTVVVTITSSYGESQSITTILNALTWGVIRGPEVKVQPTEGTTEFTVKIEITNHNQAAIYLGHPVLTNIYAIRNNLFLRMCMQRMPAFFIEKDSEQTFPNFPLMRIMDIGLAYAGKGVDQLDSFPYLDIASGYDPDDDSTKSYLVEPQVASDHFLPWLAQIVGVKLSQTTGGTTPWSNFPQTWTTFINAIDDAGDNDDSTIWQEIELYNPVDGNYVQGRRDQITTARTGHNAGTRDAIIASVQTVLGASKTVNILLDPIASPWVITIQTLDSETPTGVGSDASVLGAAEVTRPMGYTYVHTVVSTYESPNIYDDADGTYNDTLL